MGTYDEDGRLIDGVRLNGIGRLLVDYVIWEGQFKEGRLNGFGRQMYSCGSHAIGWFRDYDLYGYARKTDPMIQNGKSIEGRFVDDVYRNDDRLPYDINVDLIA